MRRRALAILLALTCGIGLMAAEPSEVTVQGMVFVSIPAGTFTMGTTDEVKAALEAAKNWTKFEEVEQPAHEVTISKPFLMGKYLVTQKQWADVMKGSKITPAFKGADLPMESVSWEDAVSFISKLNKKEGKARFRLPTEAEWEYACRAGSTAAYGLGKDDVPITAKNLGDYAWFAGNAGGKTHPVGAKLPNAWGLYDMPGNVWEWCQDWYGPHFYTAAPATQPLNNDGKNSTEHMQRGGSWFVSAATQRAAYRSSGLPDSRTAYTGFRLVCEP